MGLINVIFDVNKGLENPDTKPMTQRFIWIGITAILVFAVIGFWVFKGKNKVDTTANTVKYDKSAIQNGNNNYQENTFK